MTERFCKLFETDTHGQILVLRDEGEEGPEVRFFFRPPGLGTCSAAVGFKATERGEDQADQLLEDITEAKAVDAISELYARFVPNDKEAANDD